MSTLVNVHDLEISFRKGRYAHSVVKGISFQIPKGRVVGIVGESGSGKSVTALSLMRLLPPKPYCQVTGALFFREGTEDISLTGLSEERMRALRGRRISMVFQEPMTSLNPVLTCGEQVSEVLQLHLSLSPKEAKKRSLDFFAQVKLAHPLRIFKSYPHQLSGGQKQRVMIAMAICCEPDLIIADEPTTALDVTVQKSILLLLRELQQKRDISILFITHDLGVVREIADRVLVMHRGRIVEEGNTDTLFLSPQHAYTKGLLASRPPMDRTLKRLPEMSDFMNIDGEQQIQSEEIDVQQVLDKLEMKKEKRGSEEGEPVLKVRNLVVRYPGKRNFLGKVADWTTAVDHVSFDVKKGEILGLAGESGCGKSTLSRAILQLIRPDEGAVYLNGTNLCDLRDKEMRVQRSGMQLIFQDPYSALNPRLTVGEAILEPMKLHHKGRNHQERKRTVTNLLEKVGLSPDLFDHYPHEFSGGQRQRICIARTLALEPDFMICDESVSALDVSVQARVLNLLLALKKEFGFSCIFISHDLSVVKFMSDRIMIMNKGRLEEISTTRQIFDHPASSYTHKLIAAIPR